VNDGNVGAAMLLLLLLLVLRQCVASRRGIVSNV
jgi:hypothetical protein